MREKDVEERWYIWRGRSLHPERVGERCRALEWGGPSQIVVQFEDGEVVRASRSQVRRAKRGQ